MSSEIYLPYYEPAVVWGIALSWLCTVLFPTSALLCPRRRARNRLEGKANGDAGCERDAWTWTIALMVPTFGLPRSSSRRRAIC